MWDAAQNAWAPVSGVTAVSKVTFDYSRYFQASWHHGPKITMADVIYPIAQSFEIAFDEAKIQIETALGITSRPLLETYKGFRIANETTLEVYVDYWHFEEGYIAAYASPTGVGTPWELLAAMDDVVYEKRTGAYSDTSAARFSVPWISLVTESDARLVLRSIRQFGREKSIPEGVFELGGAPIVSEEEAAARYDACATWFETTNLLVLGQGPFQLTRYDPPANFAQLDAYRGEGYPFTAEDFKRGVPPRLTIDPVQAPAIALGDPISLQVKVNGPGTIILQYTLVDPAAGAVVTAGTAEGGEGGVFTVNVDPTATSALFPGLYQLYLLASSDQVAQVAEQRVDLQIGV
jgi:peptide/nickel transport system substrate-binding protein